MECQDCPAPASERLNQSCFCITVDEAALRRELAVADNEVDAPSEPLPTPPTLFAAVPVFVTETHLAHIARVVRTLDRVMGEPRFVAQALVDAPRIARADPGNVGVFMGYDFHLAEDGPKLIEINTNAGGAFLNVALGRAQRACCDDGLIQVPTPDVEASWLAMFQREWALAGRVAPMRRIAIVDDDPRAQYLYPEFLLARALFRRAGIDAVIADPQALVRTATGLTHDGVPIDLVYNRLTDFYLEEPRHRALAEAYVAGDVVLTPHPRVHALRANKRHLVTLSNASALAALGVDAESTALIAAAVPKTERVDPAQRDELWKRRRGLFFKPYAGYGSKAAYRGDKLTRATFEDILGAPYVAQAIVPPSERSVRTDGGGETSLKVDLRAYAYAGRVQLVAARLYHGQTTNFRTVGGGFATVFPAPGSPALG